MASNNKSCSLYMSMINDNVKESRQEPFEFLYWAVFLAYQPHARAPLSECPIRCGKILGGVRIYRWSSVGTKY